MHNKSKLPVTLIAIDGHGGSGKSTLAKMLSELHGAEIIQIDDFTGWENPDDWWQGIVSSVFNPIIGGAKTLNYPRSKWWESHNPEPVIDQPVTSVLILEGVRSLCKELRPYVSHGIFVDTPANICLQRGFERDKGMDRKSDEDIKAVWKQWQEKEIKYFASDNPKGFADLTIDGTKPFVEQIARISF